MPAGTAARGPTTSAAAAMPQGGSSGNHLDYLAKYGGHASVLRDGKIVSVHPGTAGAYKAPDPEFAARLAAAGQAYERATGKTPKYGEMSRGEDVQSVYYNRYKSGAGGIAAAPGRSQHQKGGAADLPDSGFRQWLYAGNASRFGLHFPVKGDTPHVQADPAFKGTLATGGPGTLTASTAGAEGPRGPAPKGPGDVRKAFLDTIAKGESPGGAYDYIIGGQRFTDYSKHPGVTGSAGRYGSSTAAGKYQFLKSTWDEQAAKYGYKDFKPETQDAAAWNYAKDVYSQKSGRDLEKDLASGDANTLNNISKTLGQTWTSLPGARSLTPTGRTRASPMSTREILQAARLTLLRGTAVSAAMPPPAPAPLMPLRRLPTAALPPPTLLRLAQLPTAAGWEASAASCAATA